MSPTRNAPGKGNTSSSSSRTPRGPTRSPQALSRGKVTLSTSATRAPPRARTSAAMLPAGPEPTTMTSNEPLTRPAALRPTLGVRREERCSCCLAHLRIRIASPRTCSRASPAGTTCSPRCCRSARTGAGHVENTAGTAGVALQIERRTGAFVTGIDLTEAMLRRGQANVRAAGVGDRVSLVGGRAEQLPFPDATFDALTYTYLLRYVADPAATLRELARVVKPGAPIAS